MSGLAGHGTPQRGSAKGEFAWRLEWTYSDTGGTPSLDTGQSDRHPDIATSAVVTDAGTGRTAVRFPKCARVWVEGLFFTAATPATAANNVRPIPVSLNPSAGTMEVQFVAANGGSAPIDPPEANGRLRLNLRLEYA